MPETEAAGVRCAGAAANCEVLTSLAGFHAERCAEQGILGAEAIVNAMAVGLVLEVWRNSPVEDMHASRRGPSDAAMFAESTALHGEAVKALTARNLASGLLDFEQHLLDRTRPWAGTGGRNLKDLGHGALGRYAKHVKNRTNTLMNLADHTCVAEPLPVYLVNRALGYGRDHKGMPGWTVIVDRIRILLANPDHPAWGDPGTGAAALAGIPQRMPPVDQLAAVLRTSPSNLPEEVLTWLSSHLLYCAAPPYGRAQPWES